MDVTEIHWTGQSYLKHTNRGGKLQTLGYFSVSCYLASHFPIQNTIFPTS